MRKILCTCIVALSLFLFAGSASAFLTNWYVDIDGSGGGFAATQINELLDTVGPTYIDNTLSGSGGFSGTFDDWGVFKSFAHDTGADYSWGSAYELTGAFTASGTVVLDGPIAFTSGTLDIYADGSPDFATTAGGSDGIYYGANNGTLIASFDVVTGLGTVDPTGVPNGQMTVTFESSFLKAGHWFDVNWVDLSTTDPINWVLGFATTNASYVSNPSATVMTELQEFSGLTSTNYPPDDLYVSTNGQYRLSVPEPATMLLLGSGLLGLAVIGRKKKFFKKD